MTMHTMEGLAAETQRLRGLARALIRDADDLAHDAYVVAATQAPADRPVGPWLVRVTRNLHRMTMRAARRRQAREREVGLRAEAPATPAELVERVEVHRRLAELVLQLPVATRDILLLRYFEDLSFVVIAKRLAIPEATVRWRHREALAQLRAWLEERQPNRAWLPALAAFAGPRAPLVSATAGGLIAAALATVAFVGWMLTQLLPASASAPTAARSTPPAHAGSTASERVAAALASPARPAAATPGELLGEQVRVTGVVLDPERRGVAGVALTARCSAMRAPSEHVRTGAGGRFSVLVERDCGLAVQARTGDLIGTGYSPGDEPDPRPALSIVLGPATYLAVRVADADTHAPVAAATVCAAYTGESCEDSRVHVDAAGTARLPFAHPVRSLVSHTYLRVEAAGYAPSLLALGSVLPDGELSEPIPLALSRGYTVRGIVLDPSGAPAAGVDLDVDGPRGAEIPPLVLTDPAPTRSEPDGRFELHVPAQGVYSLLPHSAQLAWPDRPLTISVGPGGVTGVTLRMARRDEIGLVGTVLGPDGAPFAGARVLSRPGSPAAITDAAGHFAIPERRAVYLVYARAGALASERVAVELGNARQRTVTLRLVPTAITGVTVERDGTPVAGADIWIALPYGIGRHVFSDAAGRFSILVPAGSYRLSIRRTPEDDYLDEDDVTVASGTRDVRLVVP